MEILVGIISIKIPVQAGEVAVLISCQNLKSLTFPFSSQDELGKPKKMGSSIRCVPLPLASPSFEATTTSLFKANV